MINSYSTNTLHTYQFSDPDGMLKMQLILKMFRYGFKTIGDLKVESVLDYSKGLDGLPQSDVVQYRLEGGSALVIRPSGTEPKLNVYISIKGDSRESAESIEARVCEDLENIIFTEDRMGYCCE
jgi:phosphoglucomutase